jgi:hypothetical protein
VAISGGTSQATQYLFDKIPHVQEVRTRLACRGQPGRHTGSASLGDQVRLGREAMVFQVVRHRVRPLRHVRICAAGR